MMMTLAFLVLGQDPIGDAEFDRLRKEMHVKSQAWAAAPWKVNVTEALEAAAREKKPVFLVVNTGNALGFV